MAKRKTLQAKLADLIAEYGLDAVVQAMMMAEQLGRPLKPKPKQAKLISDYHPLPAVKAENG